MNIKLETAKKLAESAERFKLIFNGEYSIIAPGVCSLNLGVFEKVAFEQKMKEFDLGPDETILRLIS